MTGAGARLAPIRAALGRGEYLVAYDLAAAGVQDDPDDLDLQYLRVLSLARAGATDRAVETLATSGLEAADLSAAPVQLREDIAALGARLAKDRALAATGADRVARAKEAAERYEATYRQVGRHYSCINAATMWLLAGDVDRAVELAEAARGLVRAAGDDEDPYWMAATDAEAALVIGDVVAATEAIARADGAGGDLAGRATTRRQLALVCKLRGVDPALLDPLGAPRVVHYCGHRVAAPGSDGRFLAESEEVVGQRVAAYLERAGVGFGYGSLACGADILVAEALLDRGAELHVVLPFGDEEFVEVSVASGGSGWVERFERCRSSAEGVTYATTDQYLGHDELFDYCARLAMGNALIRAAFLGAEAEQLAVWDGGPPAGPTGTAVDVATWGRTGRSTHVVSVAAGDATPPRSPPAAGPAGGRVVRAMLFGDVKGFSALSDAQTGVFLRDVLGPIGRTLDRFGDHVLLRNTWGDGLYVVFDDVIAAAECALALQETMRSLDPAALGLPESLGLRIGAHAGPVFEGTDPVTGRPTFYGAHVTRTARIEPRTPEGDVYVTDAFAALLALEAAGRISCEYVGHIPTAKQYGTFPMYVLKPRG